MKDALGTEIAVGSSLVHALRRSCYVKMTKRTAIAVEEKRVLTRWTDQVWYVVWDTPDGKWKNGADIREKGYRAVEHKTWIYSPRNVVVV